MIVDKEAIKRAEMHYMESKQPITALARIEAISKWSKEYLVESIVYRLEKHTMIRVLRYDVALGRWISKEEPSKVDLTDKQIEKFVESVKWATDSFDSNDGENFTYTIYPPVIYFSKPYMRDLYYLRWDDYLHAK